MESTILVAIAAQAWIGIYSCKMEIKVRKSIPHVTAGIRSTSLKQDANWYLNLALPKSVATFCLECNLWPRETGPKEEPSKP